MDVDTSDGCNKNSHMRLSAQVSSGCQGGCRSFRRGLDASWSTYFWLERKKSDPSSEPTLSEWAVFEFGRLAADELPRGPGAGLHAPAAQQRQQ